MKVHTSFLSCIHFAYCTFQGCPIVALSHKCGTGASKRATNKKLKALFNWEIFAKHDQLSLSDISLELFLIQIIFKTQ